MSDVQERRNPASERVSVATMVEVCGSVPGAPVFEAQSVNVSPRGMQLRTAYLPEAGTPLICRFESEGREIVVEGTVAWRREHGRGGEFGVEFTALDSRSVDALRALCGKPSDASSKASLRVGEPGARVRLHIDGLGSPMKARVKTGSSAKVQVGSSLEFLKVGKRLELEDLDQGARRAAEIDGVSVIIDPGTQVPQLVVALRFEGAEETTPSPSTSSVGSKEAAGSVLSIPKTQVTTDSSSTASSSSSSSTAATASERAARDSQANDDDDEEPEMRGRVATIAASAEQTAKVAGEKLAQVSNDFAKGASHWFKEAAGKILEFRKDRPAKRRTTSPAPSASTEKPRLRPQTGSTATSAGSSGTSDTSGKSRRLSARTAAVIGGSSLALVVGVAFALRAPSAPPPGAKTDSVGAADVVSGSQNANTAPSANAPRGALTANVPLFGPTPLSTTEPAPLGPPPGTDALTVEASEKAEAKASLGKHAADEAFSDPAEEGSSRGLDNKSKAGSASKPEDVTPWGHGKMRDPVIYRLRLDAAGSKINGTVEPTGFTIVIPARKVMEPAAPIAKRDGRIARVRASNTGEGAQVSFRFKESVPSYRVRLRRDYIEFLISAPGKETKETKEAKNAEHDTAKKNTH